MSTLAGAATMVRFALRRERLRIPVYVLVLAFLVASTELQSESLYPTQADRAAYAASVAGNPGLIAMVGPALRVTDVGGDVAWQWGAFGAIGAALMSMFIVGRHTRAEEQSGRSELLRAGVLGRRAPAVAAAGVAALAALLAGAGVAGTMIALGQPAAGSLALGASFTGAGLAFAAIALLAMQVSQSTSGAYAISGAALGAAYLLRAAGDVGDGTLSWLSPIGWAQAMRPFADERWWPLGLSLGLAAAATTTAFALLDRRDDGAGLVAPRPGPPAASDVLVRPLGLAVRLGRNALAAWAAGLFLAGVSIGLTGRDAESIVGHSSEAERLFAQTGGGLVDNYLAVSMLSMALVGTGFALQSVLRMRAEESDGRLEPLLATGLGRPRWAAANLALAAGGSVVVLAALGAGTGIADALAAHDLVRLPVLVGSAVALAPAVWVLAGAAVALFGIAPRAMPAVWGLLGACFLLAYLGPLLSLPGWVTDLSPFSHVPLLPAADLSVAPLLVLTAVAAGLAAAGTAAFRRRDVPA